MKNYTIKLEMILPFILLIIGLADISCTGKRIPSRVYVTAQDETLPVPRDSALDAADDPAIWVNFSNPDSSRIIGTDKQGGIAVYDLQGHEKFYYKAGKMNNADLRYGFELGTKSFDLIAASNRTDQSINLYRINHDGSLDTVNKVKLQSRLKEVYGLCMYKSEFTGKFYVFVNGLDYIIEQWELFISDNQIDGKIVRFLRLDSQVEGMVADDDNGFLYVGEEDRGIWRFNAEPNKADTKVLLQFSTEAANPFIKFDIEGLAIYRFSKSDGYIIASSQGNDSYAVFNRNPPHKFLGSFEIKNGLSIDGTEETDGLEVTSASLGKAFPSGLLVVQDGKNLDKEVPAPQNFKLVRWDSIATKFTPSLKFR